MTHARLKPVSLALFDKTFAVSLAVAASLGAVALVVALLFHDLETARAFASMATSWFIGHVLLGQMGTVPFRQAENFQQRIERPVSAALGSAAVIATFALFSILPPVDAMRLYAAVTHFLPHLLVAMMIYMVGMTAALRRVFPSAQ